MKFWTRRRVYLILQFLASSCPVSLAQTTTIGFSRSTETRMEQAGPFQACPRVIDSESSEYSKVVEIAYQDREAVGSVDYKQVPVTLTFSNQTQEQCFNVEIIDDDRFEDRETFLVNLTTTDPTVLLMPSFFLVTIEDNERLLIGWDFPRYTVREEEGRVKICASLVGMQTSTIPLANIITQQGTAREGIDYRDLRNANLDFVVGERTTHCYNITIIPDIRYEDTETFTVEISVTPSGRIDIMPLTTTIEIIDYNVVEAQRPETLCAGLRNLVNISASSNFTCNTTACRQVECSSPGETIALSLCNSNDTITVGITNEDVYLNETVDSMLQPQLLNYTTEGGIDSFLSISFQVVTINESQYYILSLESSSGLVLPMTALPSADCLSEEDPCSDGSCSVGSSRTTIYIITGLVVGMVVLILSAVFIGIIIYAVLRGMVKPSEVGVLT